MGSSGNKEKAENCWVLCIITFSKKPLLLKTKTLNTLRSIMKKIAQIVLALSKENDRRIDGMFAFCHPCARAESR